MRTAKKNWAGVAALAITAPSLVAGCGVTVEGQPEANGHSTEASVEWNPCSQLPNEALQAAGVDPSQKNNAINAPGDRALFRVCSWDSVGGPYHVGIGATALTQDEWYDNTEVTDVKPQQINGRTGLRFYPDNGDQPIRACYVSLPMEGGSLFINVDWQYSQRSSMPESPPCALAVQHAQKLEPYLPQ
ncbi:DUF3558 domain-containing protein [Nocardia sp. NBC_01329]|uniref:DUF3558 domain-containing protein n=1 Tax=Nocardia sp. NBC_01329 TaxID=2903594 RepID=UPI002E0D88CE|nr:DUF3558 domain-containing protein [Nocardia sp. NBC_01329]